MSLPDLDRFPFTYFLPIVMLLLINGLAEGQRLDMKVLGGANLIEIPFDLENDFIVVSVLLNSEIPLRFIIDTGAENTVLLDKKLVDLVEVDYRRRFEIRGADVNTLLIAHLATGVDLLFSNRLLARNRSVLVLEENYINFERITGTNIHGILGADFFMRFVMEVDYRRQILILHEPKDFRPRRKHVEIPSQFIRNRPYLKVNLSVSGTKESERLLLLDTGAGLCLLMHTFPNRDTTATDLPEQTIPAYIANGLGGSLKGSVGRSRTLNLANRRLTNVVTYFQEVDTARIEFLNNREGILGNRVLKRFNLVVDYVQSKVYLKPEGRNWKQRFTYDRSGMSIIAGGDNLRKYSVSNLIPGGPAERAGIQVRDRIRAINGISTTFLTLETIIKKLEGKVGKRVRVRVNRAGRLIEYYMVLEDLI